MTRVGDEATDVAGRASELSAADVEAIARRVVDLLAEERPIRASLLDTADVAKLLGLSEPWVREHAAELGAIRIGDGPRGSLRFELASVREAMERRRMGASRRRRPTKRSGSSRGGGRVELLALPQRAVR